MKNAKLLILIGILFTTPNLSALTGREIMEKSDRLREPDSGKSHALMLIHKGGRIMEKELTIKMKKVGNNDRVLISFIRPTRIKLLTHNYKGGDDNQWLRLSSGKIKRIASSDKDKPFVNSHLFYEDLESRELDDYTYKYTGDTQVLGSDCYKVEAVKKSKSWIYDRCVLYVRKSDYFVIRIDIYRGGSLFKFLENHNIKIVKGIITPFKSIMYQADRKGKTELFIKSVNYNIPMSSSLLSKEALR